MRRILLVAKRDYIASVRAKAFLVGLIVAPILFGGGFIGIALLKAKPDLNERRIAVIDRTGIAAGAIVEAARAKTSKEAFDKKTGRQVAPRYIFEPLPADSAGPDRQRLTLSDQVRRGELFAFLEVGAEALHPPADRNIRIAYYTNAGGIDEFRRWLAEPVNEGLRKVRLAQLGVDRSRHDDVLAYVPLERMSLVTRDQKTGNIQPARKKGEVETFAVPFTLVLLLGMIIMVGAAPMLSAIAEDKTQRVFEMLLGSATPFELMMGKVLAAVGRSLTSSVFYVIGGISVLYGMAMTGLAPLELLPWFFIYLVADVMVLGALGAALGAACSSAQDAQNLGALLLSPVLIPFFMMTPVVQQPNGILATTLSLFPPFTPMLMLLRQAMPGGVPAWQPWVGLVGVAAWTLGVTWAAARIFRIGLLVQGKTPKVGELLRWAVRG